MIYSTVLLSRALNIETTCLLRPPSLKHLNLLYLHWSHYKDDLSIKTTFVGPEGCLTSETSLYKILNLLFF